MWDSVVRLLRLLCLGLRPAVRLTLHQASGCRLRSQAWPFTCRAIQPNQRVSCDTPFKANTCLRHLWFQFQASRKNKRKVIQANEGGKKLLSEILRRQISHDGDVSSLLVHSAHAFTGCKIHSVPRQDSLAKTPKAIRTLLCEQKQEGTSRSLSSPYTSCSHNAATAFPNHIPNFPLHIPRGGKVSSCSSCWISASIIQHHYLVMTRQE